MTGLESVITEREFECYPKLVVSVGANVAPGQLVLGCGLVAHAPFARALACASYRRGARYIDVHYDDRHLTRALVESGPDELVRGLELLEGGRCVGVSAERVAPTSCARTWPPTIRHLFDENATCHIAHGAAVAEAVEGDPPDDGFNVSSVHTEFMIGGPGVSVDGVTRDRRTIPLLREDVWQLPE
jgi:leucyl aminopeptidase (aminopeptidase T)